MTAAEGERAGHDLVAHAEQLVAAGRASEAAALLAPADNAGRGGILLKIALGRALTAAGKTGEALSLLREVQTLAPTVAEAALALGEALLEAGHLPTAIGEIQRALRLSPHLTAARYHLGRAWLEAGEWERARPIFAAIADDPDFGPAVAARLREADAMAGAARAPSGYVRHLFDQFSAEYDGRMLNTLGYRAHLILRELAALFGLAAPLAILDLGCGTGLAGAAFVDLARSGRLDGMDLSPRMIERARARGIYDDVIVTDLEQALAEDGRLYDLVVAADTLVYLGDLSAVFEGAFRRLNRGGMFLFTVERKNGAGYDLGEKRRYRHGADYLREEAARAGFDLVGLLECIPRTEAGEGVQGFAAALQRP